MDALDKGKVVQELRDDYKTAEEWMLFYHEREVQFREDSRYILDESPAFRDTGRSGVVGNGWTEYKVVQLATLDDVEKWLVTIRLIESILSPKKRVFLEMRRRAAQKNKTLQIQGKRKTNWMVFVQQHYAITMAEKYGVKKEKYWLSEDTIKRWWKEIVGITRLIALKKKCTF